MTPPMKVLLVSDTTHFALTDVYYGYLHAFQDMGVDVVGYPMHHFIEHHKKKICLALIHSQALLKVNGYTHIIFIGGLNIPREFLESFHGIVKVCVVATEDPHTFDPLRQNLDVIDYYFTNERAIALSGEYGNVYYSPTAADTRVCGCVPRERLKEEYLSDILFLGAIYPNRQKYLEKIIPWVKKSGIHLKVLGHPQYLPQTSPIWEYIPPENYIPGGTAIRTIPHEETVRYYNGAKISLNFYRDVTWDPSREDLVNHYNTKNYKPESMNPRSYEVPLCGGFLLTEDTRSETREFYTEDQVGFFSNTRELLRGLKKFLVNRNAEQIRTEMAQRAYLRVATRGTYLERAKGLVSVIAEGDG